MKAIAVNHFIERYSDLQVSDVPSPSFDPATEILVRITHAGVNHVDLLYSRGLHQNNHAGLVAPPFILGLEFAGVVESAPATASFQPGDEVWGSGVGAFAEQIAVKESALQRLPQGWSLDDVAGLGAATAPVSYGALVHVAELKADETVLVHAAAGGLGLMACQIGKALGARVIGTVGSQGKADVLKNLGVDTVVRYDRPDWEKKVLKLTHKQGVEVVYDTVGLVEKSLRCLKYGGRIVVAGFVGLEGKMEKVAMNRVLLKGAKVLGYRFGESGRRNPAGNVEVWKGLNAILETGRIKPAICARYKGLEKVPYALDQQASRKVWGKAIIEIGNGKDLKPRI